MPDKKISIDSNIRIYALNNEDHNKKLMAQELIKANYGHIVIPFSILLETGAVLKKMKIPLDEIAKNLEDISYITTILYPTADTLPLAIQFQNKYKVSWFDSIILAGANHSDCGVLYSEDMSHNQIYGNVRVTNPFL